MKNINVQTPPKLVIFDLDGTLVETEALLARIISQKLQINSIPLSVEEISSLLAGVRKEDSLSILEKRLGLALDTKFMENAREEARAALVGGLAATQGARELLSSLAVPFCIASSASRFDLVLRMRAADLFDFIGPRFFSADDVGVRKPDPSVFLLAAEAMGVLPQECMVIEDSAPGLEAARRANMRYCAFVGGQHHTDEMRTILQSYEPEAMLFDNRDLLRLLKANG
nr:HAD family phosphatase [uncultured Cohaesibacter sp.]